MIIKLPARAKINLTLDVCSKRPDGYHDVEMVMQTVELADTISISKLSQKNTIKLVCNDDRLPADERNLAYKAAKLFLENYQMIDHGVQISIDKRIPLCAGMAGGSADAAAVLKGMNKLFGLKISQRQLMKLGKQIGADVPFCILEGTALAEGIGDVLTPLNDIPKMWFVLAKPPVNVSTKWAYTQIDKTIIRKRPDTPGMIEAIKRGELQKITELLCNVMEEVTADRYPIIKEFKQSLTKLGALGSSMTGSGPTVFGMFSEKKAAVKACEIMRKNYPGEFFVTSNFIRGGGTYEEKT